MHTSSVLRQYIPQVGAHVKLRRFDLYTTHQLPTWSWLKVIAIVGYMVRLELLNGNEPTGHIQHVPHVDIDPPIGWEPRYTIYCKPDQIDKVLLWFSRGIAVWQSHDLNPNYMPKSFTPLDAEGGPGWQFPERTDAIAPEDCAKLIRVVRIDEEEIDFIHDPACEYCHGSGMRSIDQILTIRGWTKQQLEDSLALDPDKDFFQQYDSASGKFRCFCRHNGFSKIGRTKRAFMVKAWEKEGWKTERVREGNTNYWVRTKETVVHDWSE
jgi:hypothetical protein